MSLDIANSSSVTLRNGVEMPLVGLGTSHQGGFSHEAILHALRLGYRFASFFKHLATDISDTQS